MSLHYLSIVVAVGSLVSAGVPASAAEPTGQHGLLALEGLTVLDMTGAAPREGTTILIDDGRIAELYPTGSRPAPPGARARDQSGRYAIPGLIDAHVHLTSPFERPGQQDSLSHFLLLGGITAIRDMAGDGVVLRERSRAAMVGSVLSPRIFYSTVVGGAEFFAKDSRASGIAHGGVPGQLEWQRSVANERDAVAAAEGAKRIGATGVKLYAELSPELVGAVSRAAHAHGLKVWSHAAIVPAKPSDAVSAGVDVLSHVFMTVLETKEALPPTYGEALDLSTYAEPPATPALTSLFAEMQRRGTMLDATLVAARRLDRGHRVREGDLSHMRGVERWALEAARLAHRAGVRFVAGTDLSGYPGHNILPTLHEELAMYVEEVGMTPEEALATATRNGGEMLGDESGLGTIEPGKVADLVILGANPFTNIRNTRTIVHVVKAGAVHEVDANREEWDTLDWKPSWPGTEMAMIQGNPFSAEPFVFRFRMPDGYWVHPHRHAVKARLRVVSGTLLIGTGVELDSTAVQALPAGAEMALEAGVFHFEGAQGETVVEVIGEGPWGVAFVDPSKDPAKPQPSR